MQLQDDDAWSGSCHWAGSLVHLRLQLFRCFLSTVSGYTWQTSPRIPKEWPVPSEPRLGRPSDVRDAWDHWERFQEGSITCTNKTLPYKACKNLGQKLYLQRTSINSGCKDCWNMTLMFGYLPYFWANAPTTLAEKTSPNFRKIRLASQPPTTAAWCFFFWHKMQKSSLLRLNIS